MASDILNMRVKFIVDDTELKKTANEVLKAKVEINDDGLQKEANKAVDNAQKILDSNPLNLKFDVRKSDAYELGKLIDGEGIVKEIKDYEDKFQNSTKRVIKLVNDAGEEITKTYRKTISPFGKEEWDVTSQVKESLKEVNKLPAEFDKAYKAMAKAQEKINDAMRARHEGLDLGMDADEFSKDMGKVKSALISLQREVKDFEKASKEQDFDLERYNELGKRVESLTGLMSDLSKKTTSFSRDTDKFANQLGVDKRTTESIREIGTAFENSVETIKKSGSEISQVKNIIVNDLGEVVKYTEVLEDARGKLIETTRSIDSKGNIDTTIKNNTNNMQSYAESVDKLDKKFHNLWDNFVVEKSIIPKEIRDGSMERSFKDMHNAYNRAMRAADKLKSDKGTSTGLKEFERNLESLEDQMKDVLLTFHKDNSPKQLTKEFDSLSKQIKEFGGNIKTAFDADGNINGFTASLNKAVGQVEKISVSMDEVTGKLKRTSSTDIDADKINKFENNVEQAKDSIKELRNEIDILSGTDFDPRVSDELNLELEKAKTTLKELEVAADGLSLSDPNSEIAVDNLKKSLDQLGRSLNSIDTENEQATAGTEKLERSMEDLERRANSLLDTQRDFLTSDHRSRINAIISELKELGSTADFSADQVENLQNELKKVQGDVVERKANMNPIQKAMHSIGSFAPMSLTMSATYAIANAVEDAIRQGFKTIVDMDTAMVELRKVTNETDATYQKFMATAVQTGKAVGRTGIEVIEATSDFSRMGYSLKESVKLAEEALLMLNVGDGLDGLEDATQAIISTLKAFNVPADEAASKAREINDIFNEVSNNFAVDTKDLVDAVQTGAAVMKASGNDIYETIALFTASNEVMQNSKKVATGWSTIAQRIKSIQRDAETGELSPKLAETLAIANVELQDANGNLKSTYDVVVELAQAWKILNEEERAFIAEQVAGKNRAVVFEAAMTNSEALFDVRDVGRNSKGSAFMENQKYLDSIEGKLSQLKATWESLLTSVVSSDLIKGTISGLTSIVSLLDTVVGKLRGVKGQSQLEEFNQSQKRAQDELAAVERSLNKLKEYDGVDSSNIEEIQDAYNTITSVINESATVIYDTNLSYEEQIDSLQRIVDQKKQELEIEKEIQNVRNKDRINELTKEQNKRAENLNIYVEEAKKAQEKLREIEAQPDALWREQEIADLEARATLSYVTKTKDKLFEIESELYELGYKGKYHVLGVSEGFEQLNETVDSSKELIAESLNLIEEGDLSGVYEFLSLVDEGTEEFALGIVAISDAIQSGAFSTEELQELAETFPEFNELIDTASIEQMTSLLGDLSSEVSFLNGVIDEYNENGSISLDTAANIVSNYPELIQYLEEENGKYYLKEGIIQALTEKHDQYNQKVRESIELANQGLMQDEMSEYRFQTKVDGFNKLIEYYERIRALQAEGQFVEVAGSPVSAENIDLIINTARSMDELNMSFNNGQISVREYVDQYANLYNTLSQTEMSVESLAFVNATAVENIKGVLQSASQAFAQGQISVQDYMHTLERGSDVMLQAYASAKNLKQVGSVWLDQAGNVDKYATALSKAMGEMKKFNGLMETFSKNSKAFEGNLDSKGMAKFTEEALSTEPVKKFQQEWQAAMLNIQQTSPQAWDVWVDETAQSLGWTREEVIDSVGDINSGLYKASNNFNLAVNGSVDMLNQAMNIAVEAGAKLVKDLMNIISQIDIKINFDSTGVAEKFFAILPGTPIGFNLPQGPITISPQVGNISSAQANQYVKDINSQFSKDMLTGGGLQKAVEFYTKGALPEVESQVTSVSSQLDRALGDFTSSLQVANRFTAAALVGLPNVGSPTGGGGGNRLAPGAHDTGTTGGSGGSGGGGGGGSGGGGKSKEEEEEEVELASRYATYNAALERSNQLLEKNDALFEKHRDDYDKLLQVVKERKELDDQHQQVLHATNQARRVERAELEAMLSEMGYIFEGEGDSRFITNLSEVALVTKENEDILNRYIELTGEIEQASRDWWQLEHVINNTRLTTEGLTYAMEQNASIMSRNDVMIERMDGMVTSLIPFLENRTRVMEQRYTLLEQRTKVTKEEMQGLQKVLEELGFEFTSNDMGTFITNLEYVNDLSETQTELLEEYLSKQGELGEMAGEIYEIEKALRGATNAAQLFNMENEMFLASFEHQMSMIDISIQKVGYMYDDALKVFSDSDTMDFSGVVAAGRELSNIRLEQYNMMREQSFVLDNQLYQQGLLLADAREYLSVQGAIFDEYGNIINLLSLMTGANATAVAPFLETYNTILEKQRSYEAASSQKQLAMIQLERDIIAMEERSKQEYINKQKRLFDEEQRARKEDQQEEERINKERDKSAQEAERRRVEALNKQLQIYRDNLSAIHTVQESLVAIIRKRGEIERDQLEETHKAELDSIKERKETKIDAYKEEADAFKKMIQEKLDAYEEQWDKEDFIDQLREEENELNELKELRWVLSLDTSLTGQNKLRETEEKIAEQQEKIDKLKQRKQRDELKKSLRDQLDDHSDATNQKIDIENQYYDESLKMIKDRQQAEKDAHDASYENDKVYLEAKQALYSGYIKSFDGQVKDLYSAFMDYQYKYGQAAGALGEKIGYEFRQNLDKAKEGLRQLETVGVEAMLRSNYEVRQLADEFDNLTSSINKATEAVAQFEPDLSGWESPFGDWRKELEEIQEGIDGKNDPYQSRTNPFNMPDEVLARYTENKRMYEALERQGVDKSDPRYQKLAEENRRIRLEYNMGEDNYSYSEWLDLIKQYRGEGNIWAMSNADYLRVLNNKLLFEENETTASQEFLDYLADDSKFVRGNYGVWDDDMNSTQMVAENAAMRAMPKDVMEKYVERKILWEQEAAKTNPDYDLMREWSMLNEADRIEYHLQSDSHNAKNMQKYLEAREYEENMFTSSANRHQDPELHKYIQNKIDWEENYKRGISPDDPAMKEMSNWNAQFRDANNLGEDDRSAYDWTYYMATGRFPQQTASGNSFLDYHNNIQAIRDNVYRFDGQQSYQQTQTQQQSYQPSFTEQPTQQQQQMVKERVAIERNSSGGLLGKERQQAISTTMEKMLEQHHYSYSQGNRKGATSRDCSSSIGWALWQSGLIDRADASMSTYEAPGVLKKGGYVSLGKIPVSQLEEGDILLKPKSHPKADDGHIEMYMGNNQSFGALGPGRGVDYRRGGAWTNYVDVYRLPHGYGLSDTEIETGYYDDEWIEVAEDLSGSYAHGDRDEAIYQQIEKQVGIQQVDGVPPLTTGYTYTTTTTQPVQTNTQTHAVSKQRSYQGLRGANTEEKIWNFFRDHGFNDIATAAIMGNMSQESTMDPARKQSSGGPGRGLGQWETGSTRYARLVELANELGQSPTDLEPQLMLYLEELTDYSRDGMRYQGQNPLTDSRIQSRNLEEFKNATDLDQAVLEIQEGYHRPKEERANNAHRDNEAARFLEKGRQLDTQYVEYVEQPVVMEAPTVVYDDPQPVGMDAPEINLEQTQKGFEQMDELDRQIYLSNKRTAEELARQGLQGTQLYKKIAHENETIRRKYYIKEDQLNYQQSANLMANLGTKEKSIEKFSLLSEQERETYLKNKRIAEELARQGLQDSAEYAAATKENEQIRAKYMIEVDEFNLEQMQRLFARFAQYQDQVEDYNAEAHASISDSMMTMNKEIQQEGDELVQTASEFGDKFNEENIRQFSQMSEFERQKYMANKQIAEELIRQGKTDTELFRQVSAENQALRDKYNIAIDQFNYQESVLLMESLGTKEGYLSKLAMLNEQERNLYLENKRLNEEAARLGQQNTPEYQERAAQNQATRDKLGLGDDVYNYEESIELLDKADKYNKVTSGDYSDSHSGSSSSSSPFSKFSAGERLKYLNNKKKAERLIKEGKQDSSEFISYNRSNQSLREKYGIGSDNYSADELERLYKQLGLSYSEGGKITHTGLALVHGSNSMPEYIFNKPQFEDLARLVATYKPNYDLNSVTGGNIVSIQLDNLINIQGNVDNETIPLVEKAGDEALKKLGKLLKEKGIKR